jgi:ABC-2 type transport system ATP-binding protein
VYESLTAQENLEFFSEMYGVPKDERARRIDELLETFGLSERRSSKVETFSKGMKQKLALARTLVHDPPIVFLDEPTSGLDPESAKMVREKISEMSSRADKTVFICTHNLAEAESLCGRVGIIKSGKILQVGSPRDLQEDSGPATYSLHLEHVPPGLPEVLRGLECVDAVQQRTEHVLEVSLSSDDLAPDLVAAALGAGARVREFRRETKSLEDVYLEAVRD